MQERLLILGGAGMLGHKLAQTSSAHIETYCTFRERGIAQEFPHIFGSVKSIDAVSVEDFDSVAHALTIAKPTTVINCIGVVKQIVNASDAIANIETNALFPHRLFKLCQAADARLILLSTDCVFSGKKGNYVEEDSLDATDLYGRSKALGEINQQNCLTIRTSMIGRQLERSYGLLEWFLSQNNKTVSGYKKAIFSGLPTTALAETILQIATRFRDLLGIYHVAANPINKFDLLSLIKDCYELNVQINPDESVCIDRSLNDTKFRNATKIIKQDWTTLIAQMHNDPTPYKSLQSTLST